MSTATGRSTTRRPAAAATDRPSAWIWAVVVAAFAVLALLVAWLAGWIRFTTDPRVTEIVALQEQARARFGQGSGPANLADAAALATAMMEIRQKTEALPEHLRPQAEQAGRGMFQAAFRARIDAFFTLPPEKRQAEIDRQIDQEETMRKAFEAGRTVASALGGGGSQTGSAPVGNTAQPSANPPPGGPGGSRSEEERNRWRKSMIDRTTPQERARYTEWRRAKDARREQRGLPSGWPR
ncbi:MAG: hypothetical protein ACKO1M_13665 [Planctomycetota bacterium]